MVVLMVVVVGNITRYSQHPGYLRYLLPVFQPVQHLHVYPQEQALLSLPESRGEVLLLLMVLLFWVVVDMVVMTMVVTAVVVDVVMLLLHAGGGGGGGGGGDGGGGRGFTFVVCCGSVDGVGACVRGDFVEALVVIMVALFQCHCGDGSAYGGRGGKHHSVLFAYSLPSSSAPCLSACTTPARPSARTSFSLLTTASLALWILGARIGSGRSRVRIPFATGFFRVESYR